MTSVLIAPSILAADFARLGDQVREAEAAGADLIHIDVMDGHFVPQLTVGPLVVAALRRVTRLPLHVHLMVENPERHIAAFAEAGAELITVHIETCPHLYGTLEMIRQAGAKPAVVLNPATPLALLEEVLDQVALILVMMVNPGNGGQTLIPQMLDKVRRLKAMLEARRLTSCLIEVDGGINGDTIIEAVRAGANVLVMGSAIFGHKAGVVAAIRHYREILKSIGSAPREQS